MGDNGEPLAHGRIWSGPLKLLLPALAIKSTPTNHLEGGGEQKGHFGSLEGMTSNAFLPLDPPVKQIELRGEWCKEPRVGKRPQRIFS